MKFYEIVKKLQVENEGYIILVRCGIFYNAIGKDAVFMQEKFSIGTEYKASMYRMLENIMYLNKFKKIEYLNKIDVELNIQRVCLRILKKNKWIDIKKFNIAIDKIIEIGKILGGLIKYYGKNTKE